MVNILLKRAYEPPEPDDGFRILVDRLWPRGLPKQQAQIDWWARDIAPSTPLRKWFAHDPMRWDEFRDRYFLELNQNPEAVGHFVERLHHNPVTLIYGAKDKEHNHAIVLKTYLENLKQHS